MSFKLICFRYNHTAIISYLTSISELNFQSLGRGVCGNWYETPESQRSRRHQIHRPFQTAEKGYDFNRNPYSSQYCASESGQLSWCLPRWRPTLGYHGASGRRSFNWCCNGNGFERSTDSSCVPRSFVGHSLSSFWGKCYTQSSFSNLLDFYSNSPRLQKYIGVDKIMK